MKKIRIAIIGAGNIGIAIARGLIESQGFIAKNIILTRRKIQELNDLKKVGFVVERENKKAVKNFHGLFWVL